MTPANQVLLLCAAAFICFFAAAALLLLLLDLLGLTCFWTVDPYNRRQFRRYYAARRRQLRRL
jgi:hypothetical protein